MLNGISTSYDFRALLFMAERFSFKYGIFCCFCECLLKFLQNSMLKN